MASFLKVIVAGMNPIQISRGIQKTADALVLELKVMSRESNARCRLRIMSLQMLPPLVQVMILKLELGSMISKTMQRVGRDGFITIEKGISAENILEIVEGMQFDRGYLSKYFSDRRTMKVEFQECKLLLVDKILANPKEVYRILDIAVKGDFPIVIIVEGLVQWVRCQCLVINSIHTVL